MTTRPTPTFKHDTSNRRECWKFEYESIQYDMDFARELNEWCKENCSPKKQLSPTSWMGFYSVYPVRELGPEYYNFDLEQWCIPGLNKPSVDTCNFRIVVTLYEENVALMFNLTWGAK